MIGEVAGNLDNLNVVDAGPAHHRLGGLAAGDVTARRNLHVFAIGAGHPHLRVKREDENKNEEQDEDWLRDEGKS